MKLINRVSITAFNALAAMRGYRFKMVSNDKEYNDANAIYEEDAFTFPEELAHGLERYKAGTLNFIAYHKGTPVGMVRLADPKVVNRAWEHYGVDQAGEYPEVQSLVVRKGYRDGAQFVMLGLVKELFLYSQAHAIRTWSACGKRNVYLTMRRYCRNIEVVDIDFQNFDHPVTQYLYANKIVETYFIMKVSDFEPLVILKRCVKRLLKGNDFTGFIYRYARKCIAHSPAFSK